MLSWKMNWFILSTMLRSVIIFMMIIIIIMWMWMQRVKRISRYAYILVVCYIYLWMNICWTKGSRIITTIICFHLHNDLYVYIFIYILLGECLMCKEPSHQQEVVFFTRFLCGDISHIAITILYYSCCICINSSICSIINNNYAAIIHLIYNKPYQ